MAEKPAILSDDELPVVARLVIEIRSDGSRTVARGALEQAEVGVPDGDRGRVDIEARGGSPAALAADLLRALISLPLRTSLSRWTGREGHVPATSPAAIEAAARPVEAPTGGARGLVGRVREELGGRLRRRLGLAR